MEQALPKLLGGLVTVTIALVVFSQAYWSQHKTYQKYWLIAFSCYWLRHFVALLIKEKFDALNNMAWLYGILVMIGAYFLLRGVRSFLQRKQILWPVLGIIIGVVLTKSLASLGYPSYVAGFPICFTVGLCYLLSSITIYKSTYGKSNAGRLLIAAFFFQFCVQAFFTPFALAFVSHPKWHFFLSGLAESFLIVSMIVFYFYSRERDLAEAKARETEAVKARDRFLANMSHEFRTPLHGILGLLDLASRCGGDATRQRYLAMATDAAHSLQARVRELLDFSSLQTEKVRLVSKPFNLRLMLDSLTSSLAVPAAQKGLNFCAWATEDLPHCLVGDAERLKQVLVNLGANAIKFTPAGEVEIKARLAGQDDQGCLVEFSIADTGMGISQEEGQKIFSPFHRVDDELASEQEGSGLGLAISDELVKAMGGEIKLRSWPGKGSTFFFTLRLAMEQTSQQQPGGGLRASLALQNSKTALAIGHTLANLGVECSASDAEAMAAGRAHGELWFIDGSLAGPVHEAIAQKARNASPPARLVVLREMNSAGNGMDLGEKADVLLLPPRYGDLLGLLQEIRQPQGRAATAALQAPEVPVYGKDGRQPLVLVAEDNPISQTIITALLKERGLGVHLAEDGGQAAAMAKERVYDLI